MTAADATPVPALRSTSPGGRDTAVVNPAPRRLSRRQAVGRNRRDAATDVDELRRYLGGDFRADLLTDHAAAVDAEAARAPDETTFYRTSEAYLYDLTEFARWPTKVPYRQDICRVLPAGGRLLDYGCGVGSDGLRLRALGYEVDFADFDNPSTRYLRWRLAERQIDARVFDVEGDVPGGYDLVYCFDVIEHIEDPFAFLDRLESLAGLVAVNFLEHHPADIDVHHDLPIGQLLDRAERNGLLRYRRYHRRSHFVIYRSPAGGALSPRERRQSSFERRAGGVVSWRPPTASTVRRHLRAVARRP